MKTIFKYIFAISAIALASACTEQIEENNPADSGAVNTYEYRLSVSQESTSKASIDSTSILWDKTDELCICSTDGNGAAKNASESGGRHGIADGENYVPSTSADFVLNIPEGLSPIAAAYPYYNGMTWENTDENQAEEFIACNFTIPEKQTAVLGNLPKDAFAMIGRIENGNCQMHTACAVIKFEITNENITSLEFKGNNNESVSGRMYVYASTGEISRETNSVAKRVLLTPEGEVFEKGEYYFVTWPQNYKKGFTITITSSDGQTAVRSSGAFETKRNRKYTGFGSDQGWVRNITTGTASKIGTQDGTTASLYGILPSSLYETDVYGFEISENEVDWTVADGVITKRFTSKPSANIFYMDITGLTPGKSYYYRMYFNAGKGVTTYGRTETFKTYADSESAIINLYNCVSPDYWPFTDVKCNSESDTMAYLLQGTSSEARYKNEVLTMTTADGYQFTAKVDGGIWLGSTTLTMGKTSAEGDYLRFPIVEGKRLVSVSMVAGSMGKQDKPSDSSNNLGRPSIEKVGTDQNTVVGAIWNPLPLYINKTHTWDLVNTEAGAQYQMAFNHASNRYIKYLEVVYQNASSAENNKTIVWDFNQSSTWPFDSPKANFRTSREKRDGTETDLEYITTDGYTGRIHTSANGKDGVDGSGVYSKPFYNSSDKYLCFGSYTGDYLTLPVVEGMVLKNITLTQGHAGSSTKIDFGTVDAAGNFTSYGAETKTLDTAGKKHEYALTDTNADTEYVLWVVSNKKISGNYFSANKLELYYERQ